ncbi:MAG: prepilin-type N-terminal cleavage/methylation domain-containing protein [Candidatus Omnitrophota bacterium]|jgi:prepilin-type N-terminal cleavage/methylation domain-containing protein
MRLPNIQRLISNAPYAKGVTLFELVMVMVIVGIMAGVSSLYIRETVDLYRFLSFRSEVVSQGRLALMTMAREVRQVRDNFAVTAAGADEFRFTDIHEPLDKTIKYSLSGNQLKRTLYDENGSQTADNTLAAGVSALAFTYYDVNGTQITPVLQPTNLYWVKISITLASGTQSKTLSTMVHPRNIY